MRLLKLIMFNNVFYDIFFNFSTGKAKLLLVNNVKHSTLKKVFLIKQPMNHLNNKQLELER